MLFEKEKERKEKVKALLIRAYKKAKDDYEDADVWNEKTGEVLMDGGKILNKTWFNRIIISYLSMLEQKLIEKGDAGI
jgi:hypothetical protein